MKIRSNLLARGLGLVMALALLAGTAGGPALAEAAPAAQDGGQFITVVVKPGENLSVYTRLYGVTGSAILAVNTFKDPHLIYPGDTVVIPVIRSFTPSLTTPFYYTAQAGDTLADMSRRFEMSSNLIARANGGSTAIVAGQTYLIPAGPHVHTVQAGETLKIIAARYRVTVDFLLTGNSLPNPDFIYPGQQIFVPIIYNARPVAITGDAPPAPAPTPTPAAGAPTAVPAPTGTPAAAPAPSAGNFIVHTVRTGESLVTYVIRYGVSAAAIRNSNPQIKDPNLIYPGDAIIIPVAVSFTPSRTTPFYYVVQGGETAASIGANFMLSSNVLAAANPGASFAAGTTILVPAGPHIYVVQPGDTLKTIAAMWGTTVDFLLTGNSLPNPDFIYPGQQIFIPIRYNAAPLGY